MKFKSSIDIDAPLEKVVEFFIDPGYLPHYQPEFISKTLMSGSPQQVGSVSRMIYKFGNREMEMTETIVSNRLPGFFEAHYHHKHMDNTMVCSFSKIDENKTRYDSQFEYTRISWVMPKLIAILFPGMYRKQGARWLANFKAFAEKQ